MLDEVGRGAATPALGATVFTSDEILAEAVVGVRRVGEPDEATLADRFYLGGASHAMTAALVARLVEQNVVEFDTTLGEIFSEIDVDPGYASVSLRALLSHTGGIDDDHAFEVAGAVIDEAAVRSTQRTQFVAGVLASPPHHEPGSMATGSGVGYLLVGVALERVTGEQFADLMDAEVLGPLNIDSCRLQAPSVAEAAHQPWGHSEDDTPVPPYEDEAADFWIAAGGVTFCAMDGWARFLQGLLDAGMGESTWLEESTVAELFDPVYDGSALGWGHVPSEGRVPMGAYGTDNFNYAIAWLHLSENVGWVIVTNSDRLRGDLAAEVVDLRLRDEYVRG